MLILVAVLAGVILLWSMLRAMLPSGITSIGDNVILFGHKTVAKTNLATAGWLFNRWGDIESATQLSTISGKTATWKFPDLNPAPTPAPTVAVVTPADLDALRAEIAVLRAKVTP